jgi:DNA/RNA-binding domain of Phe-tRNA-synthetase-like protein
VSAEVFDLLPQAVFGVVVARGVHQDEPGSPQAEAAAARLAAAMAAVREQYAGQDPKTHPDLLPYREAFLALGINPNRFPSSIEAMVSRQRVPLGIHDLDRCTGDLEVRLARVGDVFTPFGATETEAVEPGEVVYADGAEVRTRRWIWRQGEYSKATRESRNLFFPLDGFAGTNDDRVRAARDELAAALTELFPAAVVWRGFVDRDQPQVELGEGPS